MQNRQVMQNRNLLTLNFTGWQKRFREHIGEHTVLCALSRQLRKATADASWPFAFNTWQQYIEW